MNKIFKFGDNVDTDIIIPGRYCNTIKAEELAKHCMNDVYADFYSKVTQGDVIVGGYNFGCGSSREVAPIAIKACGIELIIAKSFSRIFYRNAINIGLNLIKSDTFFENCMDGDDIQITPEKIIDLTTGFAIQQDFKEKNIITDIIMAKNLMNMINKI